MSQRKERLTVTVDRNVVAAGSAAVAAGRADSLSGWVIGERRSSYAGEEDEDANGSSEVTMGLVLDSGGFVALERNERAM